MERFIGYSHASQLNAASSAEYILQRVSEFDLDTTNCISKCYDGASVMSEANRSTDHHSKRSSINYMSTVVNAGSILSLWMLSRRYNSLLIFCTASSCLCFPFFSHVTWRIHSSPKGKRGKTEHVKWYKVVLPIKAILSTYPVVQTLEAIVESSDTARSIEAHGILHGIKSISCLIVCKKIFGITADLSQTLQSSPLIMIVLLLSLKLRVSHEEWCYSVGVLMGRNHGIVHSCGVWNRATVQYKWQVVNPRGPGKLPKPH